MGERGTGTVEALFVILVLSVLFFGAVELGRGIAVKHTLDAGVGRAARGLSVRPEDWEWAVGVVRAEVNANILGGGLGDAVLVQAFDSNGQPLSPGALAALPFGAEFRLRAEVPFQAAVPFTPLDGRVIAAEHIQLVERYP